MSLAAKPDRAVFTVTDTGVGVDPEKLASLFVPFHQERVGISHAASGLGLGLAVAKGLVELQGGAIAAFSHGPGQGAEFRIELPTTTPPTDLGAGARSPVSPRDVLIVEDDPISGALLRALLAAQGHQVRLAQSGPAALEMLEEDSADIVFCDLQMPGMSGYEVVRAIRDNPATASITVVALTGYGQPEDRKQTRQAGFDDHLVKGSPIHAITDVLRRF